MLDCESASEKFPFGTDIPFNLSPPKSYFEFDAQKKPPEKTGWLKNYIVINNYFSNSLLMLLKNNPDRISIGFLSLCSTS